MCTSVITFTVDSITYVETKLIYILISSPASYITVYEQMILYY